MAPRPIEGVGTAVAAFVGTAPAGPVATPRLITSMSHFTLVFGGLWQESHLGYSVRDFFRHGGANAIVVRTDPRLEASVGQLQALRRLGPAVGLARRVADPVSLVVAPPAVRSTSGWNGVPDEVLVEAVRTAERLGALAVLDAPPTWRTADAIDATSSGVTGLGAARSTNAALYFPWVRSSDPLTGGVDVFAPSGAIAGVMARTDTCGGIWKAPAGTEAVLDVDGLTLALTDGEVEQLSRLGVNVLRRVGDAHVVWGARTFADTTDPASGEWVYVPVRRLGLFLEHSISRGLRWAATQPSDDTLWSDVRAAVSTFLEGLHSRGALAGEQPSESYVVQCGPTTTTETDVELGVVNVLVGFAPLRPAEFLELRISVKALPG